MEEAMDVTGADPADSDHKDHETSAVRQGEGGKRGRYSYSKCTICRQKKKKCEPPNRVWPSKCNRCLGLGLDCSPPEDLRTTSLTVSTQSPRIENGKIVKPHRTPTAVTTSSASPNIGRRRSLETLALAVAAQPPSPSEKNIAHDLGMCRRCELLQIFPARFLIPDRSRRGNVKFNRAPGPGHPGQRLAAKASGIWSPSMASAPSAITNEPTASSPRSSNLQQHVELGTLGDIRLRSNDCKLCLLVWLSADDQLVLAGEDPNRLDGFDQDSLTVHATWEIDGRELIPFANKVFYQPVTRHIRLSWKTDTKTEDFRPNDAYIVLCPDKPNPVGLDTAFLGRKIDSSARRELDYDQIRTWIKHCDFHHGSCRPATLLQAVPLNFDGDHRVLDVESLKLIPLKEDMEYVVLSYTWSENKRLLERSRYDLWHKVGLDEADLEPDVRTGIHLMRQLGKSYLWVDSLCVVHDDLSDRNRHYPVIDRIFANASLTICAAHPVRPPRNLNQHMMSCGANMSLLVHHPLETYIRDSTWSKGAWTSQDRLLSGRCLIFSTDLGRAWFQCQEESMSQDIFECSYRGYSADMVHNPVQIWNELSHPSSNYRAYIKSVELYTTTRLPSPEHALRAFEGIANFLSAHYGTRFFRGLPGIYLDMALLWTSVSSDTERRTFRGRPVAPSWSWASWTGEVTYRAKILTGAVENIHDWLKEHTWITWYLADYEGRLGQIGTFATGQLEQRAEGREPSRGPECDRQIVPPTRETRWPSRNQTLFFKKATEPVKSPGQMDSDENDIIGRPYFLQFWTWSAFFQLGPVWTEPSDGQGTPPHRQASTPVIRRFNILDINGDICGSIVLPNEFADKVESKSYNQDSGAKALTFEFVALSDAKYFRSEEIREWTYYIPKKREDSFWDLWYVLLVEKDEMDVSRRVGLGKVFKDAFHQSFQPGMEWREFILA
ncbi:hypothetical protein QBC37DRAFT_430347 [Rhypophila decipiens]|uniref:Zn(2)-C6 fungal-type domain-containing protein n=1 Tax=Rhypophila decipiens TaxID=261697 RepID=A0AAN6Y1H9_9PEZI|nr:hypothetical protein QBC37DRAFT_430347 [Rhypophila decipiens]